MQNRGSENPAFGAGILFGRKYAYFRQTTNGVDYQMCKPESDTLDTCSDSFQGDLTNGVNFLIIYKWVGGMFTNMFVYCHPSSVKSGISPRRPRVLPRGP